MIYDILSKTYDVINGEVDYKAWADFIERIFDKECTMRPDLVLDLGCGTGSMTLELASRGYDMTGVDYSSDMLGVAEERAVNENKGKDILWLCQDIREFELYGTVDAVVCCLDTVNHLSTRSDLYKCFSLVHNYLIPDGIFVFDVNTKEKFENVYANECYAYEQEGSYCIWQNFYNEKSRLCEFYITMFTADPDGRYQREDGYQTERMYTLRSLKKSLQENGFEFLAAYSDYDMNPGSDNDDRMYIVAKCLKEDKKQ